MPLKTGTGNEKAYRDANNNYVGLVYHEDTDTVMMIRADANGNLTVNVVDDLWTRTEYDYDANDNVIYKGFNTNYLADGTESDWLIIKYTYDVNDNVETKQKQTGVWNNRVGLSW